MKHFHKKKEESIKVIVQYRLLEIAQAICVLERLIKIRIGAGWPEEWRLKHLVGTS